MLTLIDAGKFTSDGNSKKLELPAGADFMEVINYTAAEDSTNNLRFRFDWQKGFDPAAMIYWNKSGGGNTVQMDVATTGGFTYVEALPNPEAVKTGTAITAANPAEVTINSHGYANGDRIRIFASTGMLQIAGMDFTIGSVAGNTFELDYLDASGFAAAATAVKARRLTEEDVVDPAVRYITNISQAAQAVVTFSVEHNYQVNQYLELVVPSDFGMVEADGLQAKVVAVSAANNTVTLDLDTTAFTAFAFPASGSPLRFPEAAPAGHEKVYDGSLGYQSGFFVPYMLLPGGANSPGGDTDDVMYWRAYRSERYQQ